MKTMVSRILMTMAALMVLLMSSIPHHHHCTFPGGIHHVDYVCFASQDEEAAHCACGDCQSSDSGKGDSAVSDSGEETSSCGGDSCGHHPCGDSENCRLHSIVTLLEKVRNLPAYQPVLEFVVQEELTVSSPNADSRDASRVVLSENLTSFYLIRAKGLRAPPSAWSCFA